MKAPAGPATSSPPPAPRSLRDLLIARADGHEVSEEQFRAYRREQDLLLAAMATPQAFVHGPVYGAMFEGADYRVAWEALCAAAAHAGKGPVAPEVMLAEMCRRDEQRFAGMPGDVWLATITSKQPVTLDYALDVLAVEVVARAELGAWRARANALHERIDATRDILGLREEYITESTAIALTPDAHRLATALDATPWDPHVRQNPNIVPTGFPKIDRSTGGGPSRGYLVVVGGGSSDGKSSLGLRYSQNQARMGRRTLTCSGEDDTEMYFCRMLSDYTSPRTSGKLIRNKAADPLVVDAALAAMHTDLAGRWYFKHKPKMSVGQVCAAIRRHRYTVGIDSVVVDYLQAIPPDRGWGANRVQDTAHVISELKRCFGECNVVGVVLSQYSRDSYAGGAEPGLTSCKYAGDIENESELMVLLWRDEDGKTHGKIAKDKWSAVGDRRYLIPVDAETGHQLEWVDDYAPREARPQRRGKGHLVVAAE